MRNITMSMLVNELKSYKLCGGVNPTEIISKLFHHVVPLNEELIGEEDSKHLPHKGCVLLMCEQYPLCIAYSEYVILKAFQ